MGINVEYPVTLGAAAQQLQQQAQQVQASQQALMSEQSLRSQSGIAGLRARQAQGQQLSAYQQQLGQTQSAISEAQKQQDAQQAQADAYNRAVELANRKLSGKAGYMPSVENNPLVGQYYKQINSTPEFKSSLHQVAESNISALESYKEAGFSSPAEYKQTKSFFAATSPGLGALYPEKIQSQLAPGETANFDKSGKLISITSKAMGVTIAPSLYNKAVENYNYYDKIEPGTFGGGKFSPYGGAEVGATGGASIKRTPIVKFLLGLEQSATEIGKFPLQYGISMASGGTLVTKNVARSQYGLTDADIAKLYAPKQTMFGIEYNPSTVTGSEIINYKYFKPTSLEREKTGKEGTIAKGIVAGVMLAKLATDFGSSFSQYRTTGATVPQALSSATSKTIKSFSPLQMDTETSMIKIKTGTPIEMSKSNLYSKTSFPEEGGMITSIKGEKVYQIPTELKLITAPTLDSPKTVTTIGEIPNYQAIDVAGTFKTIKSGELFVTTGGGTRNILTYKEVPTIITEYGVKTEAQLNFNKQLFSGGGTSVLTRIGKVTNVAEGTPIRGDIINLKEDVIKGLTEFKLTYPEGKSTYVLKGNDKSLAFGKGEFKFRNIYSAQYNEGTDIFKSSFIPPGRPNIARGVSISAPTEILVDIKKLPDETGSMKDFMIQITKGESRGSLFGGGKNTIVSFKTVDINKYPFSLSGGGGKGGGGSISGGEVGTGGGVTDIKFGESPFLAQMSGGFQEIITTPYNIPNILSTQSKLGSFPIPKFIQTNKNIVTSVPITTTQPITKSVLTNLNIIKPISTSTPIALQKSISTPISITTPITTQIQITTPVTIPISITTPITSMSSLTTPEINLISGIPFLWPTDIKIRKSLTSKLKTSKAFKTLLKRRGKFFEIGRGLSRTQAIKKGEGAALSTLARTFKIQEMKTPSLTIDTGTYNPNSKEFRGFRIQKGTRIPLKDTWIQKQGIQTRSEVSEILQAKRSKVNKLKWI